MQFLSQIGIVVNRIPSKRIQRSESELNEGEHRSATLLSNRVQIPRKRAYYLLITRGEQQSGLEPRGPPLHPAGA